MKVMSYSTQISRAGISSLVVSETKELTLAVTHLLLYSYLPHRCPGHTLHLWSPPQSEGVAKPRGRRPPRRAEELVSRPIPPIVPTSEHVVPLWVAIDLYLSLLKGCLPAGVWPFQVCIRLSPTQPLIPALLRRSQVRHPVYDGIYCGEYLQPTLFLISCIYDISRCILIGGYGKGRSFLRMCLCTKGG